MRRHLGKIPIIAYTKGSSIVEMFASVLGETLFRKVLRDYVRVHEFKSVTTRHFFDVVNTSISASPVRIWTGAILTKHTPILACSLSR